MRATQADIATGAAAETDGRSAASDSRALPACFPDPLGIHDALQLSIWAGVSARALGTGLHIASPFWGALAVRFGGKPMLIRALLFGGLAILLTGFVRTPFDATALRFRFGPWAAQ